jgi:peroxiredoxin Q/BCP
MAPTLRLEVGDTAPAFSLTDADGNNVGLGDFRGQKVALYFYPAAATPRSAEQAREFQDGLADLKSVGVAVVGISPDLPDKLSQFRVDENLTFPLLSDPDLKVSNRWGAVGTKKMYEKTFRRVIRATFVVDETGQIEFARYNIKAGHTPAIVRRIISNQNTWPQPWTEPRLGYESEQEM